MATIQQLLNSATRYLSAHGLDSPREDAELIIATITRTSRTYLMGHPEKLLASADTVLAWRWLKKRAGHYPIQYLRGFQEFYGYEFLVSPEVLVPRPETELLVDVSLELLRDQKQPCAVLDVGTGSGCIAISLLLEVPSLVAVATDISESALSVAQSNADRNSCTDRLRLLPGNIANPTFASRDQFDLVISNPPYVAMRDEKTVSTSVLQHEPPEAVFAGESGFEVIEKLFERVPSVLKDKGHLVLEMACGQEAEVSKLGKAYGWERSDLRRDLAGINRCAVFRRG